MTSLPEIALLALLAASPGPGRQGGTCIALAGEVLAVGGHGGVDLYLDGKRKALGEPRNTFGLAFRGERLLEAGGRAGESGSALAWEWRSGKLLWSVEVGDDIEYSVAASEKRVFVGGADGTITAIGIETGKVEGRLEGHAGAVLAVAISPDGRTLASGGTDRSIRIWDAGTLAIVRAIHNHGDAVRALAWAPDGKRMASGSSDRTVRIWEPSIGRLVRIVRGHDAAVLSLAHDGASILSGSADGKVRRIDPESAEVVQVLEGHSDWVQGVAASADRIASVDWAGKTMVWKARKGEAPAEPGRSPSMP